MNLAKHAVQIILKAILAAAIVAFFVWIKHKENITDIFQEKLFSNSKTEEPAVSEKKKFPEPTNPEEMIFNWRYGGKDYSLKETLHRSVYDFYNQSQKNFSYEGNLPADWKDQYFQMFVEMPNKDFVASLAGYFREAGIKNKLNDDQVVELAMSFVQAIPYDQEKARMVLSGAEGDFVNYPYETLYIQKGICSDKSFLAYVLLKELGYGVALLTYEAENHMAIGIQCPLEYSNYESGYCYAETTTSGHKIGIIPDLNSINNEAIAPVEIGYFGENKNNFAENRQPGQAEIYQKSEGKTYGGIIKTTDLIKEINLLRKKLKNSHAEIASLKNDIREREKELSEFYEKLEKLKKKGEYEKYNSLVDDYNQLSKSYRRKVAIYNEKVNVYNLDVVRYNKIVREFSNF